MDGRFDLVIRGGTVVDGSGRDPFVADVGVRGARIAAIGADLGPGVKEIDATGRIVTPGFVDIHTHYDGQVTWAERMTPSSDHGVTTVVMGNCAIGFAPARADQHDLLMKIVAGVEDIPEPVMAVGLPWNWETFPEYLDAIEQRRCDVDFAAYIAHAPIRVYVMGARGADREPANTADLRVMTKLVEEAMAAGALGVSTSHTFGHRRSDGRLAPCETSGEIELLALAEGLRASGSGVYQLIIDFDDFQDGRSAELELLKRVARQAGRPVSVTLVQAPQNPDSWRTVLQAAEQANAEGLRVWPQVAPRPVGMNFGLDLSFNPFVYYPSYKAIAHLPLAERVERMRDPAFKARLLAETPEPIDPVMGWMATLYPQMFLVEDVPDYEPPKEKQIGEIAKRGNRTAAEVAYDMLLERDGEAILYLPIVNYVEGNLDVAREMMASDATLVALGDGGAHLGLVADASNPTYLMTHWVRDRARGRFPLAWAVNALTRKPAEAVGLRDRGLIAAGYKADLNVIDMDRLRLLRPEILHDLPAGGTRIYQRAEGYEATILSGVVTYNHGAPTGALPGRLIRGAQPDGAPAPS